MRQVVLDTETTGLEPNAIAFPAVRAMDQIARQKPELSDVIGLVGRPRRSSNTSA